MKLYVPAFRFFSNLVCEFAMILQVHSYYKMRSNFFVPIPSIEGSTGPNWMKFCMGPSKGISRVTIEGFFDIRSGGPDMGYPWGPRGAKFFEKNFFDFFHFFQHELLLKCLNHSYKY